MSMYFPGYQQAKGAVAEMDEAGLLSYIDGLFGREALPEGYSLDELRAEALAQCKTEFTDFNSDEYQKVTFFVGLMEIQRNADRLR